MTQISKKNKNKGGYAIEELIFYIAFFAIISLVVINAIITMVRSLNETAIQSESIQSGNIMERMSREIRQASSINSISSTDLTLNTKGVSGADTTVEFKLLNQNDLELLENGILTGNLNTANIAVTNLSFTQIITTQSQAVKIFLTVKPTNDPSGHTENFYDTVVLRGSYSS